MAHRKKRKQKGNRLSWFRIILLILVFIFLGGTGVAAGFVAGIVKDLPAVEQLDPRVSQRETTFILNAGGTEVIAKLHGEENRVVVDLEEIPRDLQDAFVAIEDERFWKHNGFDPLGIMRAAYVNITKQGFQGASTITQQLAKNAFLTSQVTIRRKLAEIILAVQLERRYTKPEILEFYLNQIHLGYGTWGVEAASQYYFGKHVSDLELHESALLAALTKNPVLYSPFENPEAALRRRNIVLNKMLSLGYISEEEASAAIARPLGVTSPHDRPGYRAPFFVDYVLEQLLKMYGKEQVYAGGLRVYTTVDLKIQQAAEEAIQKILDPVYPLDSGEPQLEAAAVVIDPRTGHIKAIVGGRRHEGMLLQNRAVHSLRPPGSAFKPIVAYTPAIALGYTLATVVDDYPETYTVAGGTEQWTPRNYDRRYRGLTTLREGLENSINVVAVKVLDMVGIRTGIEWAKKFGITSLVEEGRFNDYGFSLALGGLTKGVSPLELTAAYATFANQGVWVKPTAILKVVDKDGNILYQHTPEKRVVMKPEVAYVITNTLEGVIDHGTGTPAQIGRPAAGKTGTTSENYDAWFVGYTPQLAAGVWMGYDKEQKTMVNPETGRKVYGSTFAAPIWREIMKKALENKPVLDFPKPEGLTTAVICTESGKLPGPNCPEESLREEIFIEGTEPTTECDVHVKALVCPVTGQLATEACPNPVEKVLIKRPQPWIPYTDEKGRTYRPLDADLELPTDQCTIHTLGESVPVSGEGESEPSDQTIDLTVSKDAVSPRTITTQKGQLLRLRVTSQVDHRLSFPSFGVSAVIARESIATVEIRPDKAGVFTFKVEIIGTGDGQVKELRGRLIVTGGKQNSGSQ